MLKLSSRLTPWDGYVHNGAVNETINKHFTTSTTRFLRPLHHEPVQMSIKKPGFCLASKTAFLHAAAVRFRQRALFRKIYKNDVSGAQFAESANPEQTQIKSGLLIRQQLGGNFANHARKFEAMARARAGQQHLAVNRVLIKNKMFIGCVRIHANRL